MRHIFSFHSKVQNVTSPTPTMYNDLKTYAYNMILIKLKTDKNKNKILAAMISASQQGDEGEGGLINRVDK